MVRRHLSTEEETLWQAFARTILPLRGRSSVSPKRKADRSEIGPDKASLSPKNAGMRVQSVKLVIGKRPVRTDAGVTASDLDRLRIGDRQPGLDTTSWNALSTGKMKPQKRLDLHGHFAQDAFYKLHHFLHGCSAQGIRCVEVITGLGSGQEGGVIRQELPHWLERSDLRPLVLAVVHTHKRNKGAVRILLRAKKRL